MFAGEPLSAPKFRPIFKRMAGHDLPVWVHPVRGPQFSDYASEKASENEISFSFGWPYETTACMTRLIYSGIFDELPKLKIVSHHMGGMIPFFSLARSILAFGRFSSALPERNPAAEDCKLKIRGQILRIAAGGHSPRWRGRAHPVAVTLSTTDHCLFATDAPFCSGTGPGTHLQDHRRRERVGNIFRRARKGQDIFRQCGVLS